MGDDDCEVPCQAWTTKIPKAAQPNLNYMGIVNTITPRTMYTGNEFQNVTRDPINIH